MKNFLSLLIPALFPCIAFAGTITIEKSDSLIRNDVFDQKRARAEEYKQREAERNVDNEYWSTQIDPSCGLLRNRYLLYFCASNGRYYKGYESGEQREYRQLSNAEIKKIVDAKD
ncbi:hypothetical protein CW745_06955 [Psychromonas sp. psych-6C06]|uniref:hypothetical protein n=1 Tax=Psychromonas sp. psych-6C06 TaxID=2058089 RepID=UPI000C32F4EB|nr:hypothetical protein [Psychromonas sp. psych-6C06]PKF62294.1 hypothetical protein CW745_06955 [Psychromonas sp. psych-6C06]